MLEKEFKFMYNNYINLSGEVFDYPKIDEVNRYDSVVKTNRFKITVGRGNFIYLHFSDKDLWKKVKAAKPGNYIDVEGNLILSTNVKRGSTYAAIEVTKVNNLAPGEHKYMKKETQARRRKMNTI